MAQKYPIHIILAPILYFCCILVNMKIRILLFGVTRDIIGGPSIEREVGEDQNVGELMEALKSSYPALNDLTSLLVAVNNEYADKNLAIKENDEIALIPPVSGG